MKKIFIFLVILAYLLYAVSGCELSSCDFSNNSENGKMVSLASWNVQTFFDAVTDGNEYAEFNSGKNKWSKEKYQKRVERLCEIISLIDADILALEEVEKNTLAYDIANHLDLQTDRKKFYPYSCFACEEDGVFGNLVISRFPLKNMTTHNLDVRINDGTDIPKLRPLMEVDVMNSESEHSGKLFTLFVCHWKSKAGNDDSSEIWRRYQEALLAVRLEKHEDEKTIICGDFNQDLSEFIYEADELKTDVFIRGYEKLFRTQSAWNIKTNGGSYYYDGNWEKIDHFFSGKAVSIEKFSVISEGPHVKTDGSPFRYTVYSGEGYSDHLPVKILVKLTD